MNANWKKQQSEKEILDKIAKEFANKKFEIEFFIGSDDGGRHIEARVDGKNNASILRKLIPLNYNGWRTIVIYVDVPEPEKIILKKKTS